jgi:hypothetical protein
MPISPHPYLIQKALDLQLKMSISRKMKHFPTLIWPASYQYKKFQLTDGSGYFEGNQMSNKSNRVWAGVDIGGSHIGISFFIDEKDKDVEILLLPSGFEDFICSGEYKNAFSSDPSLRSTEISRSFDLSVQKISYFDNKMINITLNNSSVTGEDLINLLFIIIANVINCQSQRVHEEEFAWFLQGVGIGCPGNRVPLTIPARKI